MIGEHQNEENPASFTYYANTSDHHHQLPPSTSTPTLPLATTAQLGGCTNHQLSTPTSDRHKNSNNGSGGAYSDRGGDSTTTPKTTVADDDHGDDAKGIFYSGRRSVDDQGRVVLRFTPNFCCDMIMMTPCFCFIGCCLHARYATITFDDDEQMLIVNSYPGLWCCCCTEYCCGPGKKIPYSRGPIASREVCHFERMAWSQHHQRCISSQAYSLMLNNIQLTGDRPDKETESDVKYINKMITHRRKRTQ